MEQQSEDLLKIFIKCYMSNTTKSSDTLCFII